MKKLLILLLYVCAVSGARAQQVYWQQEVHYTIDVSLDDAAHALDGFLKLQYINRSPDTLRYIWFHLWPNAYKNDRTAFSEQMLENGKTNFYFSDKEQRGYINRLDFRINNLTLKTEDHPQYIDVLKVYLNEPLLPGAQTLITTPFHVQLPAIFSRGGYIKHHYNISQWYPKPAVYDSKGWHPMPYLNQGEFYSEFGSFDVRITVPATFVVAATGELQNEEEKQWLETRNKKPETEKLAAGNGKTVPKTKAPRTGAYAKKTVPVKPVVPEIISAPVPVPLKTLRYLQDNVHDFAWFANKDYIVQQDTVRTASGRTIKAFCYYTGDNPDWRNSMQYLKDAMHFRNAVIGEYPYNVVSVAEAPLGFEGGMEYPTITGISPVLDGKELDKVIEHEVGHNWFFAILGNNERDYPWLDEGLNTYYDRRYLIHKYGIVPDDEKAPADIARFLVDVLTAEKKDQPIATPSEKFNWYNYNIITYQKTANWMEWLEDSLGTDKLDAAMNQYYRDWQFKHPAPENFQQSFELSSGMSLTTYFDKLHTTGNVPPDKEKKRLKPTLFFSFKDYKTTQYINLMPAIGYNLYDKFMVGAVIHNYSLPATRFRYAFIPLYATGSKKLNGIANVDYNWYPGNIIQKVTVGAGAARFSTMDGVDSTGNHIRGGFYKVVPTLRITFRNSSARSTVEKWLEWKTYLIGEQGFGYKVPVNDSVSFPYLAKTQHRYLNQLTFRITDYRALYPYDAELQVQQAKDFYRINATANYLYNYAQGGGLRIRVFAAKFGRIGGDKNSFAVARYMPKLTAVKGEDDYTYSNYFLGRSEFTGFASQQIMNRDAALKLRYDLFSSPPVRTDNWVAAVNFNTTLPRQLFPAKIPLRVFLDVGTYAEAWKKDADYGKFLYVAGLQVTLFREMVNIYMPVIYSKAMKDNTRTEKEQFSFWKRLSFSIDIQKFNVRKIIGPNLF